MRLGLKIAALAMTAAEMTVMAAPPLSTIRDTIYKADGTRFNGKVTIEWRSFEASDTSFVGRQQVAANVVDGALNVKLIPTTTANTAAWYLVKYVSTGSVAFSEAWAVPPSVTPLRIRDIRVADPLTTNGGAGAGGLTNVEISDVQGLQTELDLRAKKAPAYSPSRAAIINAEGELEGAAGDPDDCVKVDGSAGACGGGTTTTVNGQFVDAQNPAGVVDGSNTIFTLSLPPNPAASLLLWRNGILQKRAFDYNLTGSTITFTSGAVPQPGDVLIGSYRTDGSGGTPGNLLCSGLGIATSLTTSTSLGSCTIAAGTLHAGDRLEIQFDFGHEGGTATGFTYELRWGATSVVARAATGATTVATGRTSVAIHSAGGQYSVLTWGNGLSLVADAGNATDSTVSALTLDFRGQMAVATSEAVRLRGYTVVRNPAP